MLNGIDPIILFHFSKLLTPPSIGGVTQGQSELQKKLTANSILSKLPLPVIPIYLSERLTKICIQSESKQLDIETNVDTLQDGEDPAINQRGISSTIRIEMEAQNDSIGVALFSALADLIFPKVTSKEYAITYLHGPVTVFSGLLHSFSITQNNQNDLYNIVLELIKPSSAAKLPNPVVPALSGGVTVNNVAVPAP